MISWDFVIKKVHIQVNMCPVLDGDRFMGIFLILVNAQRTVRRKAVRDIEPVGG
jgi:hypothetical protein